MLNWVCNETDFLVFPIREIWNKSSRNTLSSVSITVIIVEPAMMMTSLKYHANFNVFIIKSGGLLERAQFRSQEILILTLPQPSYDILGKSLNHVLSHI